MNLDGIIPTGKNEYIVNDLNKLVILSSYAYAGSRAYCLDNSKMYIYIDINKWVSI